MPSNRSTTSVGVSTSPYQAILIDTPAKRVLAAAFSTSRAWAEWMRGGRRWTRGSRPPYGARSPRCPRPPRRRKMTRLARTHRRERVRIVRSYRSSGRSLPIASRSALGGGASAGHQPCSSRVVSASQACRPRPWKFLLARRRLVRVPGSSLLPSLSRVIVIPTGDLYRRSMHHPRSFRRADRNDRNREIDLLTSPSLSP